MNLLPKASKEPLLTDHGTGEDPALPSVELITSGCTKVRDVERDESRRPISENQELRGRNWPTGGMNRIPKIDFPVF